MPAVASSDQVRVERWQPVTQAQSDALSDNSHQMLFCGAWGSAKTEAGLRKIVILANQFPGINCRVLRFFSRDARTILLPRFLQMCPDGWISEVNRQDSVVVLRPPHGERSIVKFGGLKVAEGEKNPWAGTEYGYTYIDEATEIPDEKTYFEMVVRSARQPGIGFTQIMLTCNAGSPGHWLYRWFYEGKAPQPTTGKVRYRLIEGPTIPRESGVLPTTYYAMLDSLTGVLRQRFVDNKWVAHEGLVYPFDPRKQLLRWDGEWYVNALGERIVMPEQLRRMSWRVGVDFGFDHPFVASWWRVSSGDYWYLVKQIYMTRRTVREHAKQMHRVHADLGLPEPIQAVCDHDAEDCATLRENGILTTPAYKDRLRGQQVVYDKFPHPDPKDPTGDTLTNCRVYFLADAVVERDVNRELMGRPGSTTEEFGGYVWATTAKEDMVKKNDDGMDEMRYSMTAGMAAQRRAVIVPVHKLLAQHIEPNDDNGGFGAWVEEAHDLA